ncbi:MAG: KTSC domain-containing protein [Bacteroidetes bacterium]|nr:KTSC domain-containing protein [Bacteroidota bacterium]MBX7047145.1 KTSC domain-containing protein [Ignavibacteria bacterium]
MLPENLINPFSYTISDIVYDEKEELLVVMFSNGKIEEFYGVIKEMYEELMHSYFRDKYFHTYIKNVYDFYFVKS